MLQPEQSPKQEGRRVFGPHERTPLIEGEALTPAAASWRLQDHATIDQAMEMPLGPIATAAAQDQ
jgi:hypothetical protein